MQVLLVEHGREHRHWLLITIELYLQRGSLYTAAI